MRLTIDPRHNIAYLSLRDKPAQVESIRVSEELTIDLAPDGTIYGIEFLNADEQLSGGRSMTVVSETLGKSTEVRLSA